MYYIMRKSYYVMHKLLSYAKNVLRYAVIITLCGNYYVMWRHTRTKHATETEASGDAKRGKWHIVMIHTRRGDQGGLTRI